MGKRTFGYIRKRPNKRFYASYVGPDHARHYAPRSFLRKMDAEAWLAAEEKLMIDGSWTPPVDRGPQAAVQRSVVLADFIEQAIQGRERRPRRPLKPSTASHYRQVARVAICPDLGQVGLASLTPAMVRDWLASLPAERATFNGHAYALLKSVMSEAVADGLITENPCRVRGAGKPTPEHEVNILSPSEFVDYIAAVDAYYRAILSTIYWNCLRSGEGRGMRRCDAADDASEISVNQGVTRVADESIVGGRGGSRYVISSPKTAAGRRTVAVPDPGRPLLLEAIQAHDAAGRGSEDLLFPARDGRSPLHDSTLRKAHNRAAAKIGRADLRLHDLRHSGLTLAAQAGATMSELKARGGHSSDKMAEYYSHATRERDIAVAAAMAALAAPADIRWRVIGELPSGEVADLTLLASSAVSAIEKAG